jgi:hypothetical protein
LLADLLKGSEQLVCLFDGDGSPGNHLEHPRAFVAGHVFLLDFN